MRELKALTSKMPAKDSWARIEVSGGDQRWRRVCNGQQNWEKQRKLYESLEIDDEDGGKNVMGKREEKQGTWQLNRKKRLVLKNEKRVTQRKTAVRLNDHDRINNWLKLPNKILAKQRETVPSTWQWNDSKWLKLKFDFLWKIGNQVDPKSE